MNKTNKLFDQFGSFLKYFRNLLHALHEEGYEKVCLRERKNV